MLRADVQWCIETWGALEACESPGERGECASCGHCGRGE